MADFDWRNPDYGPVNLERETRLIRLRKAKGEMLPGLCEYYKDHPADWTNDWASTFDPRNVERNIPATVPFLLFPKQREFIGWLHERWQKREDGVVEKSRDMGVSWLCVAFAAWMWRFYPGTVVGFGSRKEDFVDKIGDPSSLFWKLRMFVNLLPVEFRPAGWNPDKHAPFMRCLNVENGSAIVGEAGDNIGRGGRASMYFKDESSFYERPESIDAALSQTANCKIDVSTPNGAGNPFYRKRFGGKIPLFIFDWRDDPRKDQAWYDDQCQRHDPAVVAQEIDRNYEASVINTFIGGPVVDAAMARGPAQVQGIGGLRVGVDPARFGDDKFAVTIRRGRLILLMTETEKVDTIQGAAFVRNLLEPYGERPEQIAVDEIGIGAGVVDQLKGWYGNIVVGINSSLRMDGESAKAKMVQTGSQTLYYNLRAFMWGEMREWLKGASIPNDHVLKAELTACRYGFRGGSLLLESKDDMKKRGVKSPNKADSLAMTFADPTADQDAFLPTNYGYSPASSAGY